MIDKTQMIDGLRKAVALRGTEYVDPGADNYRCLYVVDRDEEPKPGCIVGTAYYIATGELVPERYEECGALDLLETLFDEEATALAVVAQGKQDAGYTWGEALKSAENELVTGSMLKAIRGE